MPRALACLAAAVVLAAAPVPARGADGLQSAYWWLAQPDGGGLPAPAHVPAGGLYVASGPLGPTAVAAVSFVLAANESAPQLTVRIRQLQGLDALALTAYPTAGVWKSGDAQPWSTRPAPDGQASPVHGVVAADQKSVTFDLAGATPGQSVSLVLVPGTASGGSSPTFDVALEPPVPGDVRTTTGETAAPPVDVPTPAPFPIPFESPGPIDFSPAPGDVALVAPPAPSIPGRRSDETASFVSPTATVQPLGRARSPRDNVILAVLLMNGLLFLGWQVRGRRSAEARPRVTIYDLPPGAGPETA